MWGVRGKARIGSLIILGVGLTGCLGSSDELIDGGAREPDIALQATGGQGWQSAPSGTGGQGGDVGAPDVRLDNEPFLPPPNTSAGGGPSWSTGGSFTGEDTQILADVCDFDYSSCAHVALAECSSDVDGASCEELLSSCAEDRLSCRNAEPPACDREVSACFETAETCLGLLPGDGTCLEHWDFCLELAMLCVERGL